MLKIVLDTNMFLSGFIFHGMIKTVFDLVLDNKVKLYVSSTLKTEVLQKLQEFNVIPQAQNEAMFFIETRGILITPNVKVTACRDPKDNYILELAQTCNADYIVTRDKDLLELPKKRWKNTKIIKPEKFLSYLKRKRL